MGYVKGGKVRRPGCLLASGSDLQERQRTGNRDNKHDSNDGFRIHSDSLLSVRFLWLCQYRLPAEKENPPCRNSLAGGMDHISFFSWYSW
jgi:hypothetical protein